jgi:hypothetical protein
MLRLVPSRDASKLDAARSVFHRYATESVSFIALAHYLNDLGFRTCLGGYFQGFMIEKMLADPVYLGYPAWNRVHAGKFHRFKDGQAVLERNYDRDRSDNEEADWIPSDQRLFAPVIERET